MVRAEADVERPTPLVNYRYAHPIGHAIEGLRYALGYHAANPGLRVSILLNAATAVELASWCPFLENCHAVPFDDFAEAEADPAAALAGVPRDWDHVVENHRARLPNHDRFAGFRAFFDAAHRHLRPLRPVGVCGTEPPAYAVGRQLRLALPEETRAPARRTRGTDRRAISVVLAGNSDSREFCPSCASWERILSALSERWPGVAILLVGKLGADGARSTSRISRAEVDRLLDAVPGAIDAFDLPLARQLALVEASDLFLSPHTGFGFAAVCTGTPWLSISGGQWHEHFFNGVPFRAVLPDTRRWPCFSWGGPLPRIEADEDGEGPRTASMCAARLREDLPALLEAADELIGGRLTFERALAEYFPRLLEAYGGDRSRIFSFENVDAAWLP